MQMFIRLIDAYILNKHLDIFFLNISAEMDKNFLTESVLFLVKYYRLLTFKN